MLCLSGVVHCKVGDGTSNSFCYFAREPKSSVESGEMDPNVNSVSKKKGKHESNGTNFPIKIVMVERRKKY